jgi:hypothetical protein
MCWSVICWGTCSYGAGVHGRRTCCTYSRAPGLQSQISARKCAPVLARVGGCHMDGRWHFSSSLPVASPFSPTPTGPSSHMHLPSGGASSVPGAADMPPSSVQLGVYHVRPFDLLQLPIEPIASPWTPPTRHVAAWPGAVCQRARNQAKTPETHVSTGGLEVSGGSGVVASMAQQDLLAFFRFF